MRNSTTQQNIPKGWQPANLSDVADVVMGQSPSSSSYNQSGEGIPFFQGNADFTDSHQVVVRYWTTAPTKLSESGDALLSVRAPVGDVAISNTKACIGRGVAAIRAKKNVSDQNFLFQLLCSMKDLLNTKAQGSTFTAINGPALKKILVALPPLIEQRKIAEILSVVDENIQKTDEVIAATAKLKGGLIQQLFSFGVGSTKFKLVKLCDVAKIQGGYAFKSSEFTDSGIPVLRISNINAGKIDISNSRFYKGEVTTRLDPFLLNEGDVVIAMSGATTGKIGRVEKNQQPLLMNQRVGRFVPSERIGNNYLYQIVSSSEYQKRIWDFAIGGAQPNISPSQLGDIEIPIPQTKKEQESISEVLASVDKKILINQRIMTGLLLLKKGLALDLLTGKKRTI